ncbi:integrase [Pseudomonas sp. R9.37]|uniref:integrase n=1 Tax=Pseudomonas sp. R9.37 TaxID=1390498 RepID=UPI000D0D4272|nr:integrase [Pseudomonas sp. R9.37]PSL91611.1 integrase [Pseudomonas sp. R9.37]
MYTVKIKSILRQVSGITIIEIDKLSMQEINAKIDEIGIHQVAFATKYETVFHVGSHCFRKRYRIGGTALYQCQRFDLIESRCKALDGWARNAITAVKTGMISQQTFTSNSRELNQFLCWSYKNGYSDLFDSVERYYETYTSYSKLAYDKYTDGKYVYHTAAIKQSVAFSTLYWFFPECTINYKPALPKVPVKHGYNQTSVPREQDVARGLGLCTEIFNGFTEALLNGWKYPFQVNLMGEYFWIVPHRWLCHTNRATPPEVSTGLWHYRSGTLKPQTHEFRIKRYFNAIDTIAEENKNPQVLTTHRNRLGKWAHDSFVLMFAANTGMNEQQIRDLEWLTGEYEVVPSTQGFRTVKWRAGRKTQCFTIATRFVKDFEQYLKLRSFLTRERSINTLFIHIPVLIEKRWRPLQSSALRKLGDAIRGYIDEGFPFLSYRQLRLYKYNYLLKEFGVVVASQIMQSSIGTIAKAYSSAADDVATKEISAYYNLLSEAHKKNIQRRNQTSIPSGHCIEPGKAILLVQINHNVAEPTCSNFITCLFCEHFVAHATTNDVRKLLSLRYFLMEIRSQSISAEEFEKLNGATLQKVNYIIDRLRNTSNEFNATADLIETEVFASEILTDYWAALLDNLVRIGAMK